MRNTSEVARVKSSHGRSNAESTGERKSSINVLTIKKEAIISLASELLSPNKVSESPSPRKQSSFNV